MDVEVKDLFATAATANQVDAGVGVIWWTTHPEGGYALTAIDYDIFDVASINADWLGTFFERSAALVAKHRPSTRGCNLRVEHPGLINILKRADDAYRDTAPKVDRSQFDIQPVKYYEAKKWPPKLDDRAFSIRPLVDSGKVVKVETGLRRFSFRAIRTNHLIAQIKNHRPGDAESAGELLHAFVLGVLLGTQQRSLSYFEAFEQMKRNDARKAAARTSTPLSGPSDGPFGGAYIPGRRPW